MKCNKIIDFWERYVLEYDYDELVEGHVFTFFGKWKLYIVKRKK